MIFCGARIGRAGGTPAFQHRVEETSWIANRNGDDRPQGPDVRGQSSLEQYQRFTVGPYRDPPLAPSIAPFEHPAAYFAGVRRGLR